MNAIESKTKAEVECTALLSNGSQFDTLGISIDYEDGKDIFLYITNIYTDHEWFMTSYLQQYYCSFSYTLQNMHRIKENDIGALLSKMRNRQSNIKQSFNNDILQYSQQHSNPYKISSSGSSSVSSFETRLERIRGIRKKFEDQYSILRQSTNNSTVSSSSQITPKQFESSPNSESAPSSPSFSLPPSEINNKSFQKRPLSAQQMQMHTQCDITSNNLKHSVSIPVIPLTARDDINNEKHKEKKIISAAKPIDSKAQNPKPTKINKSKQMKLSVKRGKNLGNLPENIYFDIFCNLDSITLAQMSGVCDSWYHTIKQSVRFMFSIPFKSYPIPSKLPSKTIFFTLKKLHFIDSKSCAELLFWSCARGYCHFLKHFISNLDKSETIELKLPNIKYGLNAISKIDSMTALHIASKHNQYEIVQILLSHKQTDINKLTKSGKHCLLIAAQRGNHRIVDILINNIQMNVNQIDSDKKSLLHNACSMGNVYAVNRLLHKGANPNVVDKENRTPLYIASENGYLDICRCLFESTQKEENEIKIDIHLASKSGKSPLYACSENGHDEVVSYLLQKGANVRQETCRGKIPLYAAAEKGYAKIVKAILPYTKEQDLFKLTHYGTTAMFIASKQSNKTVKKMLVSFCTKQKRNYQQKNVIADSDVSVVHVDDGENERKMNEEFVKNEVNYHGHQRLGTPKFAEQFESFQEKQKKQNKKRNGFNSMTTPFLERMANVLKIDNNDDENEEKDRSVPRIMDYEQQQHKKQRKRRKVRQVRRRHSVQEVIEQKEDEQLSDSAQSQPIKTLKKSTFDYDRLYKGRLRNKSENEQNKINENDVGEEVEPKKKWKGFSNRFMQRNLVKNVKNENEKNVDDEVEIDSILEHEETEQNAIEKEIAHRRAASKFLERQKMKIKEAQQKAKERINSYKNREQMDRERLIKRRDEARILAMRVAEKIKQREQFEKDLEAQMDEDIDISNLLNEEDENEDVNGDVMDTQSENLFDKMRKKGIKNEHFEHGHSLNSHRSLNVLDKLKKDKKRSLEVTGRILKVLGDRGTKDLSPEYMDDNIDGDGNLQDDEMCFLHPLSKKKKRKMKRDMLRDAYGIKVKPKKLKRQKAKRNSGNALDSLLQINAIG